VYRYVRALCDRGILEKNGQGYYRLGLTLLELSRAALKSNRDLRLTAFPSMQRIAEAVGESVSIMRLFNRQAVCIENIEGQHALHVRMEPGRTQPLHAGASSKVMLAYLPEDEWERSLEFPLRRFTDTTITDYAALREQLRAIRARGYATSDGEIDAGAYAVAVPLCDVHQEVVAALSIEVPTTRMNPTVRQQYIELLQREAEIIRQSWVR